MGEDGDFDVKVKWMEELDVIILRINEFKLIVMIVIGDYSMFSYFKSYSWYFVLMLFVLDSCWFDVCVVFGEFDSVFGGLG